MNWQFKNGLFVKKQSKIQAEQTNSRKESRPQGYAKLKHSIASSKQAFYFISRNVKPLYHPSSFFLTAQMLWLTWIRRAMSLRSQASCWFHVLHEEGTAFARSSHVWNSCHHSASTESQFDVMKTNRLQSLHLCAQGHGTVYLNSVCQVHIGMLCFTLNSFVVSMRQ